MKNKSQLPAGLMLNLFCDVCAIPYRTLSYFSIH